MGIRQGYKRLLKDVIALMGGKKDLLKTIDNPYCTESIETLKKYREKLGSELSDRFNLIQHTAETNKS